MSYNALAEHYQQQVINKLPAASILSRDILDALPPGSDVSAVPASCGLLSARQLDITAMDATDLLAHISTGEFSSVEVVTAFGIRTAIAHQLVGPLASSAGPNHFADDFVEDLLPHRLFPR